MLRPQAVLSRNPARNAVIAENLSRGFAAGRGIGRDYLIER
jgi:hypothetical protein